MWEAETGDPRISWLPGLAEIVSSGFNERAYLNLEGGELARMAYTCTCTHIYLGTPWEQAYTHVGNTFPPHIHIHTLPRKN